MLQFSFFKNRKRGRRSHPSNLDYQGIITTRKYELPQIVIHPMCIWRVVWPVLRGMITRGKV